MQAWRSTVPRGRAPEVILRHGRRVAVLVRSAAAEEDTAVLRAVTVAAVLHEIGLFVPDRGHFVARGARWMAIHLDEILPQPTLQDRRLIGDLILFHRHRGPIPGEVAQPELVDLFRQVERWERQGGSPPPGLQAGELEAARTEHPAGTEFPAALKRLERAERLRHPVLSGRIHRIRRPDR